MNATPADPAQDRLVRETFLHALGTPPDPVQAQAQGVCWRPSALPYACWTPLNTPQAQSLSHSPLCKKQLERAGAVPSGIQSSQKADSHYTPSILQHKCDPATLPHSFPMSPELREILEQHIQKCITEYQQDLLCRIQKPAELTWPWCDLAHSCQAKGKPLPSLSSMSTAEGSRDVQEVRFQLRQDLGKSLAHIPGEAPKDVSRALGSSPSVVQGMILEESERNLTRFTEMESRNDSPGSMEKKHTEVMLTEHLGVKTGQMHMGLIPLRETRVCPVQKFFFSKPCTLQDLVIHITRFRVRHRWGLRLKLLKAINIFRPTKAPLCHPFHYSLASAVSQCHHHSTPLGDMLASHMSDGLIADRGSSMRIPQHQQAQKNQSKMLAPAYKQEVRWRMNPGKPEGRRGALRTSEPTQDGRREDILEWKKLQLLKQKNTSPLRRLLPNKCEEISTVDFTQENNQRTGRPHQKKGTSGIAQSQRKAQSRPRVEHNTDEAQLSMTAVDQMLEAKLMLQHEFCAQKLNENKRKEGQDSVSLKFLASWSTRQCQDVQPPLSSTAVL
ncbi:spermatogenesis-associated protein 31C2-like [Octodon degus]|uniref:Spermatogenesis-associated protein 31C2-like n=1 Tax=Octodon degus TaxID=10160 RepID=A0A6P6DT97_OCTDE|nr:spermatogenesis-associated protein 31C2-like [Octodon degus]